MYLQILSLIGSVFLLVGYALFVNDYFKNKLNIFYWLNFIGALLIATSMIFGVMNWGSFVLQIFFGALSLYAIFKKDESNKEG